MSDDRARAVGAFVIALAIGLLGALGAGVALWAVYGWPAAVGFWGVLAIVTAFLILQTEA